VPIHAVEDRTHWHGLGGGILELPQACDTTNLFVEVFCGELTLQFVVTLDETLLLDKGGGCCTLKSGTRNRLHGKSVLV